MRQRHNITGIEAFVRVAESLSFVRAAERLGMTSSGVSKAVRLLESELKVRLLQRTTRTVRLTEEGAVFYQKAHRWLTDLEEILTVSAAEDAPLQGSIRIEMPFNYGRVLFMPRLAQFLQLHPGLTVEVRMNDSYADLVAEGVDIALRIGELEASDLIIRPLGYMAMGTYASPRYLMQYGRPQHPEQLLNHRLVAFINATGQRHRFQYSQQGKEYQLDPRHAVAVFNSGEVLADAAIEGIGIAQLPIFKAKQAIEQGALEQILPGWDAAGMPIQLVYPSRHYLPRRVQVLIEFIITHLGSR